MADQTPAPPPPQKPKGPGLLRRLAGGFARSFKMLVVRFYALAILLVVVWTGYTAVAFLARTVFTPTPVPPQYRGWETALSRGQFITDPNRAEALPVPRAPVEHYHQVDRALPADPHNGCATSGCHNPLAHTRHKETRAFANLHATFLSCMMCHDATINGPMQAMWVDTATGRPSAAPPAALRLAAYLHDNAETIESSPAIVHPTTVELLEGVAQITQDPVLHYLQVQINTSEPGSPVWRNAMTQLVEELPNHVRGEYGAKLARRQSAEDLKQFEARLTDLTAKYEAATEADRERNNTYDQIHAGVLPKPAACLTCHGDQPARLDLTALGYPAERAQALHDRDAAIARIVQQIQAGQPFHLPRMLEGGNAR